MSISNSISLTEKPLQPTLLRYSLSNVHCQKCIGKIEKLREHPFVKNLNFNFSKKILLLEFLESPTLVERQKIVNHLEGAGFSPEEIHVEEQIEQASAKAERRLLMRLALAGFGASNIMILAIAVYAGADEPWQLIFDWISFGLFVPILFFSGWPFFSNTWNALRNGQSSIDLPILIALLFGGGLSAIHLFQGRGEVYFDSLSGLIFLLLATRFFLLRVQDHYFDSSLFNVYLPNREIWRRDQRDVRTQIMVKDLATGDTVEVETGDTLPIDGALLSEEAHIDEALLSGEVRPFYKARGDLCFAGTKNLGKLILVRTTALGESTRLGKIFGQTRIEIQARTPFISRLEGWAQKLSLTILALAVVILIVYWPAQPEEAFRRFLAIVTLSCPCALALGSPLIYSLALRRASEFGLIIRRASALEKILSIHSIAFDKTGTLTRGQFQVQTLWPNPLPQNWLEWIVQLEETSLHPVGIALRQWANSSLRTQPKNHDFQKKSVLSDVKTNAKGVFGYFENSKVEVRALLESEIPDALENKEDSTLNWVGCFENEVLRFAIALGDSEHEGTPLVIEKIKKEIPVYLISGDRQSSAVAWAKKLAIPIQNAFGEFSPEQKSAWVEKNNPCLLIGDGANDSMALAKAHLGIAVRGSLATSLQASEVYFVKRGLTPLLSFLALAKTTQKWILAVLVFSFVYNSTGVTLAALGYIHPLVAAVLMPASSFTVLTLSLLAGKSMKKNLNGVNA